MPLQDPAHVERARFSLSRNDASSVLNEMMDRAIELKGGAEDRALKDDDRTFIFRQSVGRTPLGKPFYKPFNVPLRMVGETAIVAADEAVQMCKELLAGSRSVDGAHKRLQALINAEIVLDVVHTQLHLSKSNKEAVALEKRFLGKYYPKENLEEVEHTFQNHSPLWILFRTLERKDDFTEIDLTARLAALAAAAVKDRSRRTGPLAALEWLYNQRNDDLEGVFRLSMRRLRATHVHLRLFVSEALQEFRAEVKATYRSGNVDEAHRLRSVGQALRIAAEEARIVPVPRLNDHSDVRTLTVLLEAAGEGDAPNQAEYIILGAHETEMRRQVRTQADHIISAESVVQITPEHQNRFAMAVHHAAARRATWNFPPAETSHEHGERLRELQRAIIVEVYDQLDPNHQNILHGRLPVLMQSPEISPETLMILRQADIAIGQHTARQSRQLQRIVLTADNPALPVTRQGHVAALPGAPKRAREHDRTPLAPRRKLQRER